MVDGGALMLRVAVVVPVYRPLSRRLTNPLPLFSCHWYVSPVPTAVTSKLVPTVSQVVMSEGCVKIRGEVLTVKTAASDAVNAVQVPEIFTLY